MMGVVYKTMTLLNHYNKEYRKVKLGFCRLYISYIYSYIATAVATKLIVSN